MMLTTVLIGVVTLLSDFLLRTLLWGGISGGSNNSDSKNGGMVIALIAIGLVLAILSSNP